MVSIGGLLPRLLSTDKGLAALTRLSEIGAAPRPARRLGEPRSSLEVAPGFRSDPAAPVHALAARPATSRLHGRVLRGQAAFAPGAVILTGPWPAQDGTVTASAGEGHVTLRIAAGVVQIVTAPTHPTEWIQLDGVSVDEDH
ncbi:MULTISPECIES: hypothetical protein [Bacteria]|uniref:hypothetical protein n=1 Tax=Bacteria TaxID=2 RepID=UPI003C7A4A04